MQFETSSLLWYFECYFHLRNLNLTYMILDFRLLAEKKTCKGDTRNYRRKDTENMTVSGCSDRCSGRNPQSVLRNFAFAFGREDTGNFRDCRCMVDERDGQCTKGMEDSCCFDLYAVVVVPTELPTEQPTKPTTEPATEPTTERTTTESPGGRFILIMSV